MKYSYDRAPIRKIPLSGFLSMVSVRNKRIAAAPDSPPVSEYNANRLAKSLHPEAQYAKIARVDEHQDAKSFTLVPDEARGTKSLAFFRASQYVSVGLNIGGTALSKPYTIRSGPGSALGEDGTSYVLTIKRTEPGYASKWILENWKEGDAVELSGPLGDFYYDRIRDAKTVVALAGGSGITPFFSMAEAIADGIEDFELTILYGSRTAEGILLREELDAVAARSGGRVKVVHVLSDEEREGYEHGFLTAELVRKYAPEGDYSVFMCGPQAMYDYEERELQKLSLPRRRIRRELSGDCIMSEPAKVKYKLTLDIHGYRRTIDCLANESLEWAIERAGIKAPTHCRSGECGWCHARLASGEVFVPERADGRRGADLKFGWLHPCASFPRSDVELEIFPG